MEILSIVKYFNRPKEAIKSIKKRLMIKNGKVFYLTLDLLEMATFVCGLPFHTQIATKDFLMVISNLLFLKQLPEDVWKYRNLLNFKIYYSFLKNWLMSFKFGIKFLNLQEIFY